MCTKFRPVFGLDAADAHAATGILCCNCWKSYQGLDGLACAYCWAHVRRDFLDLARGYLTRLGAWARAWVERIGALYHLTAQRLLHARVRDTERADATPLHAARDALDSMRRHWEGLTLSLDHPWVPLDNNEAERLLRTSVVGRKNSYGSGSLNSGQLAECAYTVLLTAARNGLNPLTCLRAYLEPCRHRPLPPPDRQPRGPRCLDLPPGRCRVSRKADGVHRIPTIPFRLRHSAQ